MRKIVLVMIGLMAVLGCYAQASDSVYVDSAAAPTIKAEDQPAEISTINTANDTLYVDTTLEYQLPSIAKDSVVYWRNMKGFAYMRYLDSLLKAEQARKNKEQQKEEKQQEASSSDGDNWLGAIFENRAMQIILWTLAGLFILFIVFRLFLTDAVFRKNTKSQIVPEEQMTEETVTDQTDLNVLIQQALKQGNYRLAIRYHYLQTLYKLAAKNLLQLAADKTNYQYVREITQYEMQQPFAALTLNYEYVWYGEFEIDDAIYQKLAPLFVQFNNKLQ